MKDEILKCDAKSCGHIEKVGRIKGDTGSEYQYGAEKG